MEKVSISLRFLSLLVSCIIGGVQADLKCHGHRDLPPPGYYGSAVSRAVKHLTYYLNYSSTQYQTGVSFTRTLGFPAPRNDTTLTVRLLYWDSVSCIPTGRGYVNGTHLASYFQDFYAVSGHEEARFGWGTLVSRNYLIDYHTDSPSHRHSINFERKDREKIYCTDKLLPFCNPKVSNLISGTNGVFNALRAGEQLSSPNGLYRFVLEENCNMVVYDRANLTLWQSYTTGSTGFCYLELTSNLNLILHTKVGSTISAVWESYPKNKFVLFTYPATGVLTMQDDGNLVTYATDRLVVPIWATDTSR